MSRPIGSRLGAWVSDQSQVISSRNVLLAKFEELKNKFAHGEIPKPDFWGGYRVIPETIEFWQGGGDRLHDRLLYTQKNRTWSHVRLSP
jgi:pyridoxamine 5'-phosphate oxidase